MSDKLSSPARDIFSVLRGYYNSLSPSERKVADFVMSNASDVLPMTLSELAEHSGVSDATAVRFFRSAGFRTFFEFKVALTRSFAEVTDLIHDGLEEDDPPHVVAIKVFRGCIQALKDTQQVLDAEVFESALNLLDNADSIFIAGVGTSAPMAHELNNRLFRLRLNCQAETDSYLQLMKASLLTNRDVLVIISHSGTSSDPLNTATEAREHGCPVICITGNHLSPLAKLADVVLLAVSHETRSETISSRVAQHALIQAIYVALAMRSIERTNETEQLIWDALIRRRITRAK